jgi:hypothetical protein
MTLTGGKRKVNKSLKAWVAFVKKVQKEEKISYKDAIHRAKQRKDKGEKWMTGGQTSTMTGSTASSGNTVSMSGGQTIGMSTIPPSTNTNSESLNDAAALYDENAASDNMDAAGDEFAAAADNVVEAAGEELGSMGGRRRRRTARRSRGKGRGRTARRSRGRSSRKN